mmetsp:Transcript_2405/g.5105  ORF Transcript_2405/g.5105 Transcript_2405/m.5105 type:complete len:234 (-) Transcript_2405:165-866(-)
MGAFRAQSARMLATHVFVGIGAASFWRGAWYVLDDHLYPEDAVKSAGASLGLGVVGLAASQGLVERAERLAKNAAKVRPTVLAVARFGAIYTVATSCVLVWRATWVGWDVFYEYMHPHEDTKAADAGHATKSGILSHVAALTMLLGTGLFASVLAPPAAISVIRDNSVRSATRQYTPPAQSMVNQIFGGSAVRGMKSSSLPRGASRSLASANYSNKRPSMSSSASSAYRGTKL